METKRRVSGYVGHPISTIVAGSTHTSTPSLNQCYAPHSAYPSDLPFPYLTLLFASFEPDCAISRSAYISSLPLSSGRTSQPRSALSDDGDNNEQLHLSRHVTAPDAYFPSLFSPVDANDRLQIVSDHKIICLSSLTKFLFFPWKIRPERSSLQI